MVSARMFAPSKGGEISVPRGDCGESMTYGARDGAMVVADRDVAAARALGASLPIYRMGAHARGYRCPECGHHAVFARDCGRCGHPELVPWDG